MLELFLRWAYEHVAHEKSMISTGADDPNINPVSFIPTGEAIDDINSIPGIQIVDGALSVDFPHLHHQVTVSKMRARAERGGLRLRAEWLGGKGDKVMRGLFAEAWGEVAASPNADERPSLSHMCVG